jgi:chloramphenicol 3-O-phosphotransferase
MESFGNLTVESTFSKNNLHTIRTNPLVLIRGLPGSGKSTMAAALQQFFPGSAHIEADDFFSFLMRDENDVELNTKYVFDGKLLHQAHRSAQDRTRLALSAGMKVIVANTFTTRKEMQPYFDMTNGCVAIVRMNQSYGSIHNVPEASVEKMRERFTDFVAEISVD